MILSALQKHLSRYAAYHCNARNIATHMVGISLIVRAAELLLSRSNGPPAG